MEGRTKFNYGYNSGLITMKDINYMFNIINSNLSEEEKAIKLYSFCNLHSLISNRDLYNTLELEQVEKFKELIRVYRNYEAKGIIDNVRYVLGIQDYLQNYKYAKFAIGHYIESSESYKESEFLSELGLDKDTFNFCVSTIEELDVDLYRQFLEKKEINNKIRCVKNAETITNLANGINTGILSNGTQFDLLEFTKRIPFKKSNNFTVVLIDFMKRNNPQDMNTIIRYIYGNGLNTPSAFAPLDLKGIYTTKTTINGVEITNTDNDIIIDYLTVNNIPLIHKTYVLARTKYLNGEITAEMVQKQKEQLELNKIPTKVLIPSKK